VPQLSALSKGGGLCCSARNGEPPTCPHPSPTNNIEDQQQQQQHIGDQFTSTRGGQENLKHGEYPSVLHDVLFLQPGLVGVSICVHSV
jgi:hypothetical protein